MIRFRSTQALPTSVAALITFGASMAAYAVAGVTAASVVMGFGVLVITAVLLATARR